MAFAIPVSKLLSIDATRRQRTAGGELKEKQRRKCHPLEMPTADNDDVSEFDAPKLILFPNPRHEIDLNSRRDDYLYLPFPQLDFNGCPGLLEGSDYGFRPMHFDEGLLRSLHGRCHLPSTKVG